MDPAGLGEQLRVEHWTNAAEGGAAAARNLLAGSAAAQAYDPVPFFWSDQYATKIQVIGLPGPDDEVVVVEGSVEEGKLVALYRPGDRLRARPGLQPPPPPDGLPAPAGRRGLLRRGTGAWPGPDDGRRSGPTARRPGPVTAPVANRG